MKHTIRCYNKEDCPYKKVKDGKIICIKPLDNEVKAPDYCMWAILSNN